MIKKSISVLIATLIVVALISTQVYASSKIVLDINDVLKSGSDRYSVLLLDISSSMTGKPLDAQKESAIKFCEDMLFSNINKSNIAIVSFSYNAQIECEFTNDIEVLKNCINSLNIKSNTNTNEALLSADKLLNDIDNKAIKNVILCSDGIPFCGDTIETGQYTKNEHEKYREANAVYDTATKLKRKYNIYSLAFLHQLSGKELEFGKKVLNDVQNSGYYEVTDPSDLKFTFGEIANDLINNSNQDILREKFVNQHSNYYYNGSYKTDIIQMEKIQSLKLLFEDASSDITNELYKCLDTMSFGTQMINSFLDPSSYIDIKIDDKIVASIKPPDITVLDLNSSEYTLILYQLLQNDDFYEGIVTYFSINYLYSLKDATSKIVEDVSNGIIDFLSTTTDLNKSDIIANLKDAAYGIKTYDPTSIEFVTAYTNFETLSEKYLNLTQTKAKLKSYSINVQIIFPYIETRLDEIDSIGKACQYVCWAEAYAKSNEKFKAILKNIALKADKKADMLCVIGNKFDESTPYTEISMCRGLSKTITSFINTMEEYDKNTEQAFLNQILNNMGSSSVKLATAISTAYLTKGHYNDIIGLICPELAVIKDMILTIKGVVDTLFPDINNKNEFLLYIESLRIISELLIDVSNDYGKVLLNGTLDNRFENALYFDESINMYKNSLMLACEYGIKYEEIKLSESVMGINILKNNLQKQGNLSSFCINILSLQKEYTYDIHCHENGLTYNKSTGLVKYDNNLKVISIACPVNVTVTNPYGERIAYFYNNTVDIKKGYEPYFFVSQINKNECIKIITIPNDDRYKILINGTGTGNMSAFIGTYDGSELIDTKTFLNLPVGYNSSGYINLNNTGNDYLVWDNNIYKSDSEIQFTDVMYGLWYYDSIIWAVNNNITNGMTDDLFKPNKSCTRAQVVTFLWRMAGQQESYSLNKFSDVPSDQYYAKAVAWAVDNKITEGIGNNKFAPNKICTRAEIVTLLWRYKNKPASKLSNSFDDVSTNAYYANAVSWAVNNNITNGMGNNKFAPKNPCTRAQIVTFLNRMDKIDPNNDIINDNEKSPSYTVTFDANGGSPSMTKTIVTNGNLYGDMPNPVKDGYIFDGWYSMIISGDKYTSSSIVNLSNDQFLYAHWIKEPEFYFEMKQLNIDVNKTTSLKENLISNGDILLWSSDDDSIVKVNEKGVITAVSEGTTWIRVEMTYLGEKYYAKCKVIVSLPEKTISSIDVIADYSYIKVGNDLNVNAKVKYSDGSSEDITSKATFYPLDSKSKVIKCTGNKITGTSEGYEIVVAEYNNHKGYLKLKVMDEVFYTETVKIKPNENSGHISYVDKGASIDYTITIDLAEETKNKQFIVWIADSKGAKWHELETFVVDGGTSITHIFNYTVDSNTNLTFSIFDRNNFTFGSSLSDYIITINTN